MLAASRDDVTLLVKDKFNKRDTFQSIIACFHLHRTNGGKQSLWREIKRSIEGLEVPLQRHDPHE